MSTFGDRLRLLRQEADLSQRELAAQIGVSKSSVNMYERGEREPVFETQEAIADLFNVDMDYLLGRSDQRNRVSAARWAISLPDNIRPMPGTRSVPRLGSIACGEPLLAQDNIEGYDQVPNFVKCDFTLVCNGDSMIGARIYDGDTVCIRQQPEVESGQIAAVLIEGEYDTGATLKRVRYQGDTIILMPENPAYPPMVFAGPDVGKVRILGLATHFISCVK